MWSSRPDSPIKSIQRGLVTFSARNTTATATITAVETLKSSLANLGYVGYGMARIVLTNSTTVTATRTYPPSDDAGIVSFEVKEYN